MFKAHGEASYAALKTAILSKDHPTAQDEAFAAHPLLDSAIAVYRNNVRAAYYRVLRDAFPVVNALVGDSFFRRLAHDYFLNHPPASRIVRSYGDALPAFIAEYAPCASVPYLPDVARFEICWLQSYHAEEAQSLPVGEIERRLTIDPDAALIRLHPSARLFKSQFPVVDIWRQNRRENPEPMKIETADEFVLIVRPDQDVLVRKLTRGAFLVLQSLAAGKPLSETFGGEFPAEEHPAEVFQQLFAADVISDITGS